MNGQTDRQTEIPYHCYLSCRGRHTIKSEVRLEMYSILEPLLNDMPKGAYTKYISILSLGCFTVKTLLPIVIQFSLFNYWNMCDVLYVTFFLSYSEYCSMCSSRASGLKL